MFRTCFAQQHSRLQKVTRTTSCCVLGGAIESHEPRVRSPCDVSTVVFRVLAMQATSSSLQHTIPNHGSRGSCNQRRHEGPCDEFRTADTNHSTQLTRLIDTSRACSGDVEVHRAVAPLKEKQLYLETRYYLAVPHSTLNT